MFPKSGEMRIISGKGWPGSKMEIPEFAQNRFFLQNTEKYSKKCDRSQKIWVEHTQEVVEDRSRWNQFLVFASRSHRQSRLIRVILFLCLRHSSIWKITNLVLKNRRGSNLTRCGGYWKIFPSSGRIGYWWSIMWHETPFTGMCLIVRPMAAHCDLLMVKRPSCRNIFLFQKCDKNPFFIFRRAFCLYPV